MHWLDTSAVLVLTGAALAGFGFGFLRPAVVAAALLAAAWLSPAAATVVARATGGPVHPTAVVGLTFGGVLLVLAVAVGVIRRVLWTNLPDALLDVLDATRWLDRLAGAAVAVLVAGGVIGAVVYALDRAVDDAHRARMEGSTTLAQSRARVGGLSAEQKAQLDAAARWLKRDGRDGANARNGAMPTAK